MLKKYWNKRFDISFCFEYYIYKFYILLYIMNKGINSILNQNKEVKESIKIDIEHFDIFLDWKNREDISAYRTNLKKNYNKYFVWGVILKKYEKNSKNFRSLVRSIKAGLRDSIYIKWTFYGKNSKMLNNKKIYSIVSYFLQFMKDYELKYKDVYGLLRKKEITNIQLVNNLKDDRQLAENDIKEAEKEFIKRDDVDFIDKEWTFAVIDGEVLPACDYLCEEDRDLFTEYDDEIEKNKNDDEENDLHFNR